MESIPSLRSCGSPLLSALYILPHYLGFLTKIKMWSLYIPLEECFKSGLRADRRTVCLVL
jgi:hypothetical protein